MSGQVEGEPPKKKRRSKWDIHPEDLPSKSSVVTGNHEVTPPTSTAAAVAAKLNAKLASEGKLKPASAVYMPASSSVSLSPSSLASPSSTSTSSSSSLPVTGTLTTAPLSTSASPTSSTIDINDLDVREQLTRPNTLKDINKSTGVMVTVRGKELAAEQKNQENSETPLHLHVQGPTKEKVDAAVIYIHSLIRSLQQTKGKGNSALLTTPSIPPLMSTPQSSGPHYIQDKVFVGLEKAPEEFKAKARIEGVGGSFLGHISSQTGAKVYLRGRGSGFMEPTSGRESFEAMYLYISHSNQDGLTAARKLCENLIQTVQKDFEDWKRSQQPLGFGGQGPQYRPQYNNPYQQGHYGQPSFVPGPPGSSGGPNFGHLPPGPYPPPPPVPGYGFYPGPPVPHPHAVPYGPPPPGPPPPGGFGPPPPPEFQHPGPPYHHPMPPQQIPLPLDGPPTDQHPHPPPPPPPLMGNEKAEVAGSGQDSRDSSSGGQSTKRQFTETVKGTANGLNDQSVNKPFWATLQEEHQLRRFTEGSQPPPPPPNPPNPGITDTKPQPLMSIGGQTNTTVGLKGATVVLESATVSRQQPEETKGDKREDKVGVGGGEEKRDSGVMPPPQVKVSALSMPPPSFLPPRVSSTATASKPSELPKSQIQASPENSIPPSSSSSSSSSIADPSPDPSPKHPPSPSSAPAGLSSLVAYTEDSDSDIDN